MADRVALASDHAGFALKQEIGQMLRERGATVLDLGTDSLESVDYPDFAAKLCEAVLAGEAARGILVCGSGIGMSMAANRHAGIRAALCHNGTEARLTRAHNDANVLALGARMIGPEVARDCVAAFLDTAFEGGRHQRRVGKLG